MRRKKIGRNSISFSYLDYRKNNIFPIKKISLFENRNIDRLKTIE